MDRQLAATVIATFREADAAEHRTRLEQVSARRWMRSLRWLDASGLALYFLQRLQSLGLDDAIPNTIFCLLENRHADNERRTAWLFEEFLKLNDAFHQAGIAYANLKGFALIPDYCANLSLRYQTDFDFLIARRDASKVSAVLARLGFSVIACNEQVMEFKTDAGHTPRLSQLYKPRRQRSVEIHFCDDASAEFHSELLQRTRTATLHGHAFPSLAAEDMFLSQCHHLFRHLRSEWTRVSWLLELKHCVAKRRDDICFWNAVQLRATQTRESAMAVGVATRMADRAFGVVARSALASSRDEMVPPAVEAWIDRYCNEVLFATFPGSKLYLLLEEAVGGEQTAAMVREKLFPKQAPAPIVGAPSRGIVERLRAKATQWNYFLFRLRFHIAAGLQYLVESRRWNRLLHSRPIHPPAARTTPLTKKIHVGQCNESSRAL